MQYLPGNPKKSQGFFSGLGGENNNQNNVTVTLIMNNP